MPRTPNPIVRPTGLTRTRRLRRTRLRPRWLRHPSAGRVLTAVLALGAGLVTAGVVARAESATSAFGTRRSVAVARHRLEPGTEISGDDVDIRELPVAVLPEALADDPFGRVVVDTVQTGEPLLDGHLAPDGTHGPAALMHRDRRGVAIPLDGPPPPLHRGDLVDALGGRDARKVATHAVVIDVADRAVTIAVTEDEVPTTAQALLYGPVILVLESAR